MNSNSYYVTIEDSSGNVVWGYRGNAVICHRNQDGDSDKKGVLRIYGHPSKAPGTEFEEALFGSASYDEYAPCWITTVTGTGEAPKLITFPDIGKGPTLSHDITFEEDDGSPCDTGECDCCMGPIYSVSVGGLEFEETRSPDPAETWGLFLPILERNPGFAERGVRMAEVER